MARTTSVTLASVGTAVGCLWLSMFVSNAAASSSSSTESWFSVDPEQPGTFFWLSNITPTIFGQDATDFDYQLLSDPTRAKEAVTTYAHAVAANDEEALITAFLNATMGGTMKHEEGANTAWKCPELGDAMASFVASCPDPVTGQEEGFARGDYL